MSLLLATIKAGLHAIKTVRAVAKGDLVCDVSTGEWYQFRSGAQRKLEDQGRRGQANGYAGLGAGGYVPHGQLGSGGGGSTLFLREDNTWQAAGGGGAPTNASYICVALDGTLSAERRLQGTANRVSLTDGGANADLVIDIDAAYVGQASITTLGTITTGTWSATAVAATKGGTGQAGGYTAGDLLYASDASTLSKLAVGAAGKVLGITSSLPAWIQGSPWTFLAVQEISWSTGVASTVETGIPATDGDYLVFIYVWLERTVATTWGREDVWIMQVRRSAGTLAWRWTNAYDNVTGAGGNTPTQAWGISGDDFTHTVTSAGASGTAGYVVSYVSLGDLSS